MVIDQAAIFVNMACRDQRMIVFAIDGHMKISRGQSLTYSEFHDIIKKILRIRKYHVLEKREYVFIGRRQNGGS